MRNFASTFLLIYAALFPIINPLGNAPIFLAFTRSNTVAERHTLAARVARNSFLLLLGSLLVGSHVLVFFGITLPVLRIGGGLVVTSFAWRQLNAEPPDASADEHAGPAKRLLESFYPLTMPLTVGPGSMAVAIALGSQRPKASDLTHLLLVGLSAFTGIAAVAATVYLCYRFADDLVDLLGPAGTNVVVRLSAFILVCIGLQIIWSGWTQLAALPH
jgi:multiple antibiotic resistance protein